MRSVLLTAAVVTTLAGAVPFAANRSAAPAQAPVAAAASQQALVDKYCVTCHNKRTKAAGLLLDEARIDPPSADAEIWEKVVKKIHTGAMPPVGRVDSADVPQIVAYVRWLQAGYHARAVTGSP